jgi:hypothetical protein
MLQCTLEVGFCQREIRGERTVKIVIMFVEVERERRNNAAKRDNKPNP